MNLNDFSCHSFFIELTLSQSIDSVMSILLISFTSILRFSKSKIFSSESNLALPRSLLPITQNGLLKMIENTQPWNESVKTIFASMNARNHLVGEDFVL